MLGHHHVRLATVALFMALTTVDVADRVSPAIAVDGTGAPHIDYVRAGALRHAWRDGLAWLVVS